MKIDKAPLKEAKERLQECLKPVEQAYECDWDDKVHESYEGYLTDTRRLANEICEAIDSVSSAINEVAGIDGKDIKDRVSSLVTSLHSI